MFVNSEFTPIVGDISRGDHVGEARRQAVHCIAEMLARAGGASMTFKISTLEGQDCNLPRRVVRSAPQETGNQFSIRRKDRLFCVLLDRLNC